MALTCAKNPMIASRATSCKSVAAVPRSRKKVSTKAMLEPAVAIGGSTVSFLALVSVGLGWVCEREKRVHACMLCSTLVCMGLRTGISQ